MIHPLERHQPGVVVVLPVHRAGAQPEDQAERIAAFLGRDLDTKAMATAVKDGLCTLTQVAPLCRVKQFVSSAYRTRIGSQGTYLIFCPVLYLCVHLPYPTPSP